MPLIIDDPTEYEPPTPNAALVVGPHDHLVIALPAEIEAEQFQALVRYMEVNYPRLNGRVLIVAGATDIAVVRASEPLPPGPLPDWELELLERNAQLARDMETRADLRAEHAEDAARADRAERQER